MPLPEAQRRRLHQIARESIYQGFSARAPSPLDLAVESPELRDYRATFVTIDRNGRLRGCIGTLEARRALAEDVNQNAFSAAFHDTRFPPVREEEFDDLEIHISVLQPPSPLDVSSEDELIHRLRPGIDGLILQRHDRRATFLPAVWEDLSDPADFIRHLKLKAGLPASGWDPAIRWLRYETEAF